jgi:tRNA (guanine-N7-)-methyltransferase
VSRHYIDLENPGEIATLNNTFLSFRNLEIEVGTGNGEFIINRARERLFTHFVGIEINPFRAQNAADKVDRHKLSNITIIAGEARGFITSHVPPFSCDIVHIYFPSPVPNILWKWKHGQWKRLIDEKFIFAIHRILKNRGSIRIVTDHKHYFLDMCRCFAANKWICIENNYFHQEPIVGTPMEMYLRRDGVDRYYIIIARKIQI